MLACTVQALAAFPVKGVALAAPPAVVAAPSPDGVVSALRRLAVGTLLAAHAAKPAHALCVHQQTLSPVAPGSRSPTPRSAGAAGVCGV